MEFLYSMDFFAYRPTHRHTPSVSVCRCTLYLWKNMMVERWFARCSATPLQIHLALFVALPIAPASTSREPIKPSIYLFHSIAFWCDLVKMQNSMCLICAIRCNEFGLHALRRVHILALLKSFTASMQTHTHALLEWESINCGIKPHRTLAEKRWEATKKKEEKFIQKKNWKKKPPKRKRYKNGCRKAKGS